MAVFLVCAFSERPDDDCVVQPRTRLRQKDNANLMCRRVIILLLAASSLAGCSRKDDVLAIGRLTPDKGGVNGFSVPTNLGYARNPAVYAIGTEIEPNEPYFEGDTPTQYSVSPELPEGLTLDSSTGVLSGIPTVLAPTSDYIVTAETLAGSTQTTLTLKVANTAPFVTNGAVRALVRSGNTLYLGGDFTQIGPPTGPGVMLDANTGTKPGFAAWPPVNGIVYGFSMQHGARELRNGNILMFDNGDEHAPPQSRAAEYRLDLINHTATLVWQYVAPTSIQAMAMGFAQRLPNGNTLIAYGTARPPRVQEINPAGEVVWDLSSPVPAVGVYRAFRIASLY